jgi:nucleotide-binding universal stress UspA family protein
MYKRILVPLDGSNTAEAVLPYARLLAGDLKIPVELLTVVDVVDIGTHIPAEHFMDLDALIKNQILQHEKYLNNVAQSFESENVSCTVERGIAGGSIINKAGADKGTLIAMATHGRSGLRRWLLGSIAEKVLRASNNPLLLVRARDKAATDGKAALDSVMVPLDGSELAESILPPVIDLVKAIKLAVRIMRCYSVTDMVSSYEDYGLGLEALRTKSKDEATRYLDAKAEQLKKQGLTEVVSFTSEGEPAEAIIEAAKRAPNSLIAMCTHGRSGVNRWMLGSVTEKVVRHSGNPVLVIRAT